MQVRVFWRIVEPGNLNAAIPVVEAEANTFLQTVPTFDVGDIRTEITAADKYGQRLIYSITVLYVG